MKNIIYLFCTLLTIISCTSNEQQSKERHKLIDSLRVADSLVAVKISSPDMWEVSYYVDEFGEPTKQKYVTNSHSIIGSFSNSATENSELMVKFLIDNSESIAIQLFEYAGNNPVKKSIEKGYRIKVKAENSEQIILNANNYSDRLIIKKSDSKKLSNLLLKGGRLLFSIIELSEYGSSSYKFEIPSSKGYEKAINELK